MARRIRRPYIFPWPRAALDWDFVKRRYWWGGQERHTGQFTTFTLNASIFSQYGLTPSTTIDVTLALSGTTFTLPGTLAARLYQTSNAPGGATRHPVILDDGTNAERMGFTVNASNGNMACTTVDGNVTQAAPALGSILNIFSGVAGFSDTNNFLYSRNGQGGTADTSGSLPTVTTLRLGKSITASTEYVGAISRVLLFSGVRTQGELNELTIALGARA